MPHAPQKHGDTELPWQVRASMLINADSQFMPIVLCRD